MTATNSTKVGPPAPSAKDRIWELRLYIAGQTPKSLAALANLKRICEERVAGRYHLEIIDLIARPQLAGRDQILAIPTVVRVAPVPARKVLGDLSNIQSVLAGLDLPAAPADQPGRPGL